MKNEILIELAKVWEMQSKSPEVKYEGEHAEVNHALVRGLQVARKDCAKTLRMLVEVFED